MSDAVRSRLEPVLVVGAFLALSMLATYPLIRHMGDALPGDLGDPLLGAWILGWDADRLKHGLAGVWDAPILFPDRHTLAYAEHLLGIAVFVAPIIWARTIRYRISNYRIDFERGLLGKTIDTTELWHVDDIRFHQSLIERLLGVGTITVFASDQTTPAMPLRGLPKPREIFDALKARVIAIKRSRGVIKMDA